MADALLAAKIAEARGEAPPPPPALPTNTANAGGSTGGADAAAAASPEELELDRQAQALAEKALEKLPEAARALKLPKVKEGILKRLRDQAKKSPAASSGAGATGGGGAQQANSPPVASPLGASPGGATAAATAAQGQQEPETPPPPPPPPPEERIPLEPAEGIEALGDEPWFADHVVRRALRESVAAAHAEQKILVGAPLDEISRICPCGGRVLGAGAVLRLGGALLGGYGESDIQYAYRQLSRALHPDKNQEVPEAPLAFKRLTEAAEELRQSLAEQRATLQTLCATMGRSAAPEILERPQEALFAEANRLLSAILAYAGEGEVPAPAATRAAAVFGESGPFVKCQGAEMIKEWYYKDHLIGLFAGHTLRLAYDCSPKRFRAQFLCLLNRAAMAEAKRQNGCVRGTWNNVMAQYPELGYVRQLFDQLKERVWKVDEETEGEDKAEEVWPPRPKLPVVLEPPQRGLLKPTVMPPPPKGKEGDSSDPVCWTFVTRGSCIKGERCRYMHRFPPGYNVQKAEAAKRTYRTTGPPLPPGRVLKPREIPPPSASGKGDEEEEDKPKKREEKPEPKTSRWARWWREMMLAVFPPNTGAALPVTDAEVRKLSVALWRDILEWATANGVEAPLSLFSAEPSGRLDPTGEIHPAGETPEWGFVPASELFLTVGEGLLGITCQGVMMAGPAGFRQETFADASKRLEKVRPGRKPDEDYSKSPSPSRKRDREGDEASDMEVDETEREDDAKRARQSSPKEKATEEEQEAKEKEQDVEVVDLED